MSSRPASRRSLYLPFTKFSQTEFLFPHLSASENSFTDVSLRRPVPLDRGKRRKRSPTSCNFCQVPWETTSKYAAATRSQQVIQQRSSSNEESTSSFQCIICSPGRNRFGLFGLLTHRNPSQGKLKVSVSPPGALYVCDEKAIGLGISLSVSRKENTV